MENFLLGMSRVFDPYNFAMLVIGMFAGVFVGAMPGIEGPMLIAIMIPLTYAMDPIPAFLIMVAVYCGSTYGGSIAAILLRIPGDPAAVATTLDGYEMARKGQAGKALGTAMTASMIGGIFSTLVLGTLTPQLTRVALKFGPAEYFALAIFGLSLISSLGVGSQLKAITTALFGLLLATVGMDEITGYARYAFGVNYLQDGIQLLPVVIGLFGVSEVFNQAGQSGAHDEVLVKKTATQLPSLKELLRMKWVIVKSSILGTIIGILPGVGATVASMVGYGEAVRSSKNPELFGTGIMEGVAAPEAANNAAVGGAFVPLLALGIPGSASTAILIGAFIIHGMTPGPLLFYKNPALMYSIFIGMFVANILILVTGFPCIKLFSKISELPYYFIGPIIFLLCFVGVFTLRNSFADVWVMLFAGVLGYLMQKFKYPMAGLILALVLGPIAEISFRRAWLLADGNLTGVIMRPIAGPLLFLAVASLLRPYWTEWRKSKVKRP